MAHKPQTPLFTFHCPRKGYDIALIPRSETARKRLENQALNQGMSMEDFAREEITLVLVTANP